MSTTRSYDPAAADWYRRMGIERSECAVCRSPFWADTLYERKGVCAHCIRELANLYWKQHSGEPHRDFATDEELEAFDTRMGRPRRQKKPVPQALRWEVFERDGYRCKVCGSGRMLCADHIDPESAGGPATLDNLQTLCRSCNSRKGARR